MGSFLGHIVPGSFFVAFGLWWAYNVFRRYYLWQRSSGGGRGRGGGGGAAHRGYTNTATFRSSCGPGLPLEGILKVVVVAIGMTGELATAFVEGEFAHMGNAQHMTMFFFFGLNGVVDVLVHLGAPFPCGVDYLSAFTAFVVEGVLFLHHLHGRTPMDVQVHVLLTYVIGACALSTALEMYFRESVLPALGRTYFVLLQGTWFVQAGFILHPPSGGAWAQESPRQMMLVANVFCWHVAAVWALLGALGWALHARVRALSSASVHRELHKSPLGRVDEVDVEQMRHIVQDSEEEDDDDV